MDSPITKETLEYLANLARIELDPAEEPKLLADLKNILAYVSELQGVDTSGVAPMNGGSDLINVVREDEERLNTNRGNGTEKFANEEKGFLKVPPIFGGEDSSRGSE